MSDTITSTTFDEFLADEMNAQVRHQLIDGQVVEMPGGSERHDLIAQALYERIIGGTRAAGCRTFLGQRLLRVSATEAYYPDLMVLAERRAHNHYEAWPVLVVEVLSRSTASRDRRKKAAAYRSLATVEMYLLVNQTLRHIDVFSRDEAGDWQLRTLGPGDVLHTRFADIDLDELYDSVDAESGP